MENMNDFFDGLEKSISKPLNKLFDRVVSYIAFISAIFILSYWLSGGFDTDSTDGEKRSGMRLHVDNLTGCHYLSAAGGGLTARLDSDGSHYGCRDEYSNY